MEGIRFSYSRVECFHSCPYQYKLIYNDKLEAKFDEKPTNALVLGTAVHESIETKNIKECIDKYYSNYKEVTIDNELEAYKVELVANNAINFLPRGEYEYKLEADDFVGFIDMLVKNEDGTYDIYDFKYSNNVKNYLQSPQVHIYKYYFERLTGNKVRDLYYVFLPKCSLVWDHKEPIEDYKERVRLELCDKMPNVQKVEFSNDKVNLFFSRRQMLINHLNSDKDYSKNVGWKCQWCAYKTYCVTEGKDTSELKEKLVGNI